mmetsp:Transcript_12612/g.16984  ORF Transcript_12612/g.16984 Transcript_12612/m.16984 type:complete len:400 (+) Transcript_12612:99-1298(+)
MSEEKRGKDEEVERPSFIKEMSRRPSWLNRALTSRNVKTSGDSKAEQDLEECEGYRRTLHPLPKQVEDVIQTTKLQFEFANLHKVTDKPVASGCQAHVYRVEHAEHGKQMIYALKVLQPCHAKKTEELKAFQREVNLLSLLKHHNICQLVGVGSTPNKLPAAMLDWVAQTFQEAFKLKEVGQNEMARAEVLEKFPSRARIRLAIDLTDVLFFLHSGDAITGHATLHRDLKPENVGLTSTGKLKLLDFGLAVVLDLSENKGHASQVNVTYKLTGCTGSPRYMAPENAKFLEYGIGTDVYSFAILAWELFALQGKPYANLNITQHQRLVINGNLRPPLPVDSWDPALIQLFSTAWHRDFKKRPSCMGCCKLMHMALGNDEAKDPFQSGTHSVPKKAFLCCA